MPRNSAGTYSLPTSGNPVVSGTTVTSTWANATLSDLATEVSGSLDRTGRGAMLAPLQLPDGTAAAPALTAASEPTSGVYRAGSGDWRWLITGVEVLKLVAATATSAIAWVLGSLTLNGNLTMAGSNPASTTGFSNVLTKKNVPKAWATIKTDGAGGISVLDGFNVASAAINAGNGSIRITFGTALANANYAMAVCPGASTLPTPMGLSGTANKTTALCDIGLRTFASLGSVVTNLNSAIYEFSIVFYGQQ